MNNFLKNNIILVTLFLINALFSMGMKTDISLLHPYIKDIIKPKISFKLEEKDVKNLGMTCKDLSILLLEPMPKNLYEKLFKENLAIECTLLILMHEQDCKAINYILKRKKRLLHNGCSKKFLHAAAAISAMGDNAEQYNYVFKEYQYSMNTKFINNYKTIFNDNFYYNSIIGICSKQSGFVKPLLSSKKNLSDQNDINRWNKSIPLISFAAIRNYDFKCLDILKKNKSYRKYIKKNSYWLLKNAIDAENNSKKIKSLLNPPVKNIKSLLNFGGYLDINALSSANKQNRVTILDTILVEKRKNVEHCGIDKKGRQWNEKYPICLKCIGSGKGYYDKILRILINAGAKTKWQLQFDSLFPIQ